MASDVFILTLLRAQIALSAGLLLAMVLRGPTRRWAGPILAYRLWALGPAAAITSLFPTLQEFIGQELMGQELIGQELLGQGRFSPFVYSGVLAVGLRAMTDHDFWRAWAAPMVCVWFIGATVLATAFALGELRFRRLARLGLAGPAVIGVASPRLVVPFDFAQRYTAQEQGFIRRHERVHMLRQDTLANLLIACVQVLGWFNPVVHLAALQIRMDQELACDAQVVDGRPSDRRAYGEALMKVQLCGRSSTSGLTCAWAPAGRHPLELRLSTLGQMEPDLGRWVRGAVALAALGVAVSLSVWILAPRSGSGLTAAAPVVFIGGHLAR